MKHMKFAFVAISGLGIAWMLASSQPLLAQVPSNVTTALQQREQTFSHVSTAWSVAQTEQEDALPAKSVLNLQKAIAEQIVEALRERGITDPQQIQKAVAGAVNNAATLGQTHTYDTDSTWRITRDGPRTLTEGESAIADDHYQYRQLYEGSACLVVLDSSTLGVQQGPSLNPFVWAAPGDATRYPCPLLGQSLDLSPSHLTALAGINPLAMYGALWTLASTTPEAYTLTASVKDGFENPYTLLLTLDRAHGDCPKKISLTGQFRTQTLQVQDFQQYQGEWVGSKVTYTFQAPHIKTIRQDFSLINLSASKPVQITNIKSLVEDYRLAGTKLGDGRMPVLTASQGKQVVMYPWQGKFPSIDELEKLEKNQHPGEATPDPGDKSSMLPTIGGLFCLVSGVLMYRRRDKGAA